MLRCSGGSVRDREETTRSPTAISPSVGSTKPAISRSVVVLPQPDGPSRQTSRPWSMFSDTLSTTALPPYRLVRPRNSTDATFYPLGTPIFWAFVLDFQHNNTAAAQRFRTTSQPAHVPEKWLPVFRTRTCANERRS